MSDLKNYLDKSISISQIGNTWKKGLCADIVEAARTESYVETISNKADYLHKYVHLTDERTIKQAFELVSKSAIKKLGIKDVYLAIDGKIVLYYGKKELFHTKGIKYE
jgi:hypothetical protein